MTQFQDPFVREGLADLRATLGQTAYRKIRKALLESQDTKEFCGNLGVKFYDPQASGIEEERVSALEYLRNMPSKLLAYTPVPHERRAYGWMAFAWLFDQDPDALWDLTDVRVVSGATVHWNNLAWDVDPYLKRLPTSHS